MIAEGWRVTIPDWVPDSCLSLNGRRRAHYMQIAQATTVAKTITRLMLSQCRILDEFGVTDPAHVLICFVYPQKRRRDPDNLAGMAKPICDGMVLEGLLVDDDCEHITLSIAAEVVPGTTATRIMVRARDERGA